MLEIGGGIEKPEQLFAAQDQGKRFLLFRIRNGRGKQFIACHLAVEVLQSGSIKFNLGPAQSFFLQKVEVIQQLVFFQSMRQTAMEKGEVAQSPAVGFNRTGTGIADTDTFGEGGEELIQSFYFGNVSIL